jgi:hypothetical protein
MSRPRPGSSSVDREPLQGYMVSVIRYRNRGPRTCRRLRSGIDFRLRAERTLRGPRRVLNSRPNFCCRRPHASPSRPHHRGVKKLRDVHEAIEIACAPHDRPRSTRLAAHLRRELDLRKQWLSPIRHRTVTSGKPWAGLPACSAHGLTSTTVRTSVVCACARARSAPKTHYGHSQKRENPRRSGGFLWRAFHGSPYFRATVRLQKQWGSGRFLYVFPNFPLSARSSRLTWGFPRGVALSEQAGPAQLFPRPLRPFSFE